MSSNIVAVVGGGIVGSSIALRLQKEGRNVWLIDRHDPGTGASFGNASCIAVTEFMPVSQPSTWAKLPTWLLDRDGPVHIRRRYLPSLLPWLARFALAGLPKRVREIETAGASLCQRAHADLETFLKEFGMSDMLTGEGGNLQIYESQQALAADAARLAGIKSFGFEYDLLNYADIRELEPELSDRVKIAIRFPQWRVIEDPYLLTTAIVNQFQRNGGQVSKRELIGFGVEAGQLTHLRFASGDDLYVDTIVLACGAWTGALAKQLGEHIPLETERGYHTQFRSPGLQIRHSIASPAKAFVIAPAAGGIRVAGTVEMAGLDAKPDYRRARILATQAKELLPNLNIGDSAEWMGHRPALPDTIPVISRSAKFDNLLYATGHGHLGLTLAATTSRIVCDIVMGNPDCLNIAPYSISRF